LLCLARQSFVVVANRHIIKNDINFILVLVATTKVPMTV
jgi:hypothetical protein